MKLFRPFFLILLLVFSAGVSANAVESANSAFGLSAVSRQDGSLWIGTEGQGLLRVGRNGRRIQYLSSGGRIPNDSIKAVIADSLGVIWIMDAGGNLLSYTSTEGFIKRDVAGKLTACKYDGETLWLTSKTKELYAIKPGREKVLVCLLPFDVNDMSSGADGSLWLLGSEGICCLSPDGKLSDWKVEGVDAGISNLLRYSFEIETEGPVEHTTAGVPLWLLILVSVLALLLGFVLSRLLRRTPEVTEPASPVTPASDPVQSPAPAKTPEVREATTPDVTVSEPTTLPENASSFYKEVYAICEKNLSDPSFDVETIAGILGISRIHLNRKLQAEAGVSPSYIIKKLRMEKAATMVREQKQSLAEIAAACGFSTPSYFSTSFRAYYGKTPSEYLAGVSNS